MANVITFELAGKKISLPKLPHQPNKVWKDYFRGRVEEFAPQIAALSNIDEAQLKDAEGVKQVIGDALGLVDGALEAAIDTVVEYSNGKVDRAALEQAYDEEIVDAFLAVVATAIPMGKLTQMFQKFSGR